MTNEQCMAIVIAILEAAPGSVGQSKQAGRGTRRQVAWEILEDAHVPETEARPGLIVGRDEHGEEHIQPIWDCAAYLNDVAQEMGGRCEAVERHVESVITQFRRRIETLERTVKDAPDT